MSNLLLISTDLQQRILDALGRLSVFEGSEPEVHELLREVEELDYIDAIKSRMSRLDNYLNSKELQRLSCFLSDYEAGAANLLTLQAFLEVVPEGKYDGDRRKWQDAVRDKEREIESKLTTSE